MNKQQWLRNYHMLMTGDELAAWAQHNNLDAGKQQQAQEHFLNCDECELDLEDAKVPTDVTATPCPAYFALVNPTGTYTVAVWVQWQVPPEAADHPDHIGSGGLILRAAVRPQHQISVPMFPEVNRRFEERGENERGMYASQEEVDALRSLAATLVMVFGRFPTIGF